MTTIEWTNETWNPTTGCDRISPGCDNCYALTMSKRLKAMGQAKYQNDGDPRTSGPGFALTGHPDVLDEPLRWKKPRRIFVNSMSDLFHARVTTELITRVWDVMARTPQHTYQVLTKRASRLAPVLAKVHANLGLTEPLPNVWLGVSVENQKYADLRVPALLAAPAAVRFLSMEPLLGPVDLSTWMPPISPLDPNAAPRSWKNWTWPEWVPAKVRESIEGFWDEGWGRGPHSWMLDMHHQGAPAFGATVTLDNGFAHNAPKATGRYVHAWNNIGRLVLDDGSFAYTSFGSRDRRSQQPLDWVIVGGESGPGARPMDPAWAEQLVKQCRDASTAVFVKQLGTVWARDFTVAGRTVAAWGDTKGGNPDHWPEALRVREYPASAR